MQPLDLNVENRLRVDLYALFFCDICSKLFLLGLLDCQKTLQYSGIVGVTFQLLQVVQMNLPVIRTQQFGQQTGQFRIAQSQPATLGDAVGLVLEPFRINLIPVFQHGILQNFSMDCRNAVGVCRSVHSYPCHVHHAVLHQLHAVCLCLVHTLLVHLGHELFLDSQNDVIDCRQQLLHQIAVPFFQCFRHNGMIGVVEDLPCHAERLLECIAVFRQHQLTHQFRYRDDRMGIVQLDRQLVCQIVQRAIGSLMLFQNVLQRCGTEEILLFQTQLLTLPCVIVGVQHP